MPPIDSSSPEAENVSRDPEDSPFSSSADPAAFARACEDHGRSVQEAGGHLRAGVASDSQLSEDSPIERARQQAILTELAGQRDWEVSFAALSRFPLLSNRTSEHEVRLVPDKCVVKMTWPGWYGQIPVIVDGKLQRAPATPAQYLDRIDLDRLVFNGGIRLLGFCVSERPSLIIGEPPGQPSIVVSQPFYPAADEHHPSPTPEVLDQFMRAQGFLPVPDSYFGWVRLEDGVMVTDAKPDNFILSADGTIPIDLQIAQTEPANLRKLVVD